MTDLLAHCRSFMKGQGLSKADPVAVGVSGGADSLALVFLLKEAGYAVQAVSVDHGLRPEAATEIDQVAALMAAASIPHARLHWSGQKPTSNIQAAARKARYQLMADWCRAQSINTLAVAHHQQDQAETFLLRLARGSGLKGLGAMQAATSLSKTVTLIRPLLDIEKQALHTYLGDKSIQWLEDPSNQNEEFDRVAIRRFLERPPLDGFTPERLAKTATALQRAQSALAFYTDQWLRSEVTTGPRGEIIIQRAALTGAPDEIIYRGLASLIQWYSGADYPPRFRALQALVADSQSPAFKGSVLSGLYCHPGNGGENLIFMPEKKAVSLQRATDYCCYFGAVQVKITGPIKAGMTTAPLGEQGWKNLDDNQKEGLADLPYMLRLSVPALWSLDGQVISFVGDTSHKDYQMTVHLAAAPWEK